MTSHQSGAEIGHQIGEALRRHQDLSTRRRPPTRAGRRCADVKIHEPAQRAREYPSPDIGGMRTAGADAMALACNPSCCDRRRADDALDCDDPGENPRLILEMQKQITARGHPDHAQSRVVAENRAAANRDVMRQEGRRSEVDTLSRSDSIPTQMLLASIPRIEIMAARQIPPSVDGAWKLRHWACAQ